MTTRSSRRFGAVLLLAFWVIGPARAQEARPITTHHTLWKVEGQTNAVFLLGSVHALKAENYPMPAVIEAAFTNAQVVAFEADVGALDDPAMALKLMAKARLPEGEALSQLLSPAVYRQFTNHLKDSPMSAQMLDQFSPGFAAMTLVMLELQKLGLDPEYGLDKHYYPLARKAGKRIVPFETIEFQIDLVTKFTWSEGESLLKTTLKDMDTLEQDLGAMLKAWEVGDGPALEKLLNEAMAQEPAIYKRMLTDRSRSWVPKILELLHSGQKAIVIVGAGHLVGKEGVVEQLRQKGLKVTQL